MTSAKANPMDNLNPSNVSGSLEGCLSRAGLYSAISLGFLPPTKEAVACLASREGTEALAEEIALCGRGEDLVPLVRKVASSYPGSLEELLSLYWRLFGHTVGSSLSLYETEFGNEETFQKPHALADIAGFHRAFGLTSNPAQNERIDHLSAECEFLSFLALKEAYAIKAGDPIMLEVTQKAIRLFLQDHLARFLPSFFERLQKKDSEGFYTSLARLCLEFVTQECARTEASSGPNNLILSPPVEPYVPMTCGRSCEAGEELLRPKKGGQSD
jgi:DMSO reductase family type II enzyme chaperone